jgi:hypothetical protein
MSSFQSPRPRGLAALASFAITLVLFHGVASLAAPSAAPEQHIAKLDTSRTSR